MKSIAVAASLFGLARSGDGGYNYASNGGDWGTIEGIENNICS